LRFEPLAAFRRNGSQYGRWCFVGLFSYQL